MSRAPLNAATAAGREASGAPAPARGPAADPTGRSLSPYTAREKIGRVLWNTLGQTLFRLTFHNWYRLRASLLRMFGARIGGNTRIRPSVIIEQPWNLTIGDNSSIGDRATIYCLGKVTIGRNVSLSQLVHLCAGSHDYTRSDLPLLRPPITVGDEVWLAADVFVGPNVTIGEGCVVGARSSVLKDLPAWTVCAGSPARALKPRVLTPAAGQAEQEGSS